LLVVVVRVAQLETLLALVVVAVVATFKNPSVSHQTN
jgi:hypothetical protein